MKIPKQKQSMKRRAFRVGAQRRSSYDESACKDIKREFKKKFHLIPTEVVKIRDDDSKGPIYQVKTGAAVVAEAWFNSSGATMFYTY